MTAALSSSDELDLATLASRGDAAAIRALIRRYNQRLFRTARAILRDDEAAEEVVQDAWLKALRGLATFRHEAKLSTWLTRIVANEALTRRRGMQRTAEVFVLSDGLEEPPMQDVTTDASPNNPEDQAARAQLRRMVEAKIDTLPDAFRAVFVLRAVEEMTVEETAAVLGIPEATVRTRYFRARGLLREAIAKQVDFAVEEAFSFAGARCERIADAVVSGFIMSLAAAPERS